MNIILARMNNIIIIRIFIFGYFLIFLKYREKRRTSRITLIRINEIHEIRLFRRFLVIFDRYSVRDEDVDTYLLYRPSSKGMVDTVAYWSPYILRVNLTDGTIDFFDLMDYGSMRYTKYYTTSKKEKFNRFFSTMLKWRMQRARYSQIKLSEKTGIPQPTLSHYVRGTSLPSGANLIAITDALDIPLESYAEFYRELQPRPVGGD